MTLLEERQPVRAGALRRRLTWGRLVLGLVVGIAMLAAIGLPIYADHYQPLAQGNLGGRGPDSGLLELNDGLQATRWVVAEPGKPAQFIFSLANRGRFSVKVLSVGDPDEGASYFRMNAIRMDDPRPHLMGDNAALPFAPFELKPGQQRVLRVAITTQPCTSTESGGWSTSSAIQVTYRFWGKQNDASVPLELPVGRACPATGIRPHVDPPIVSGDSRFVPSGYNFGVPRGWTAKPLENFGGPASFASWTSPDGKSRVVYEENGGMAGVLYDENGQPTEAGARAAAGCNKLAAFSAQSGGAFFYSCQPVKGLLRSGFVWVKPSPDGFERVEMASPDQTLVDLFLKNVKI